MTSLKTNTETSTARTIHKQQGMNSVIGVEFNDPRLVFSSSVTSPKDNMAKLTHAEKSEEYVVDDNEEPPPFYEDLLRIMEFKRVMKSCLNLRMCVYSETEDEAKESTTYKNMAKQVRKDEKIAGVSKRLSEHLDILNNIIDLRMKVQKESSVEAMKSQEYQRLYQYYWLREDAIERIETERLFDNRKNQYGSQLDIKKTYGTDTSHVDGDTLHKLIGTRTSKPGTAATYIAKYVNESNIDTMMGECTIHDYYSKQLFGQRTKRSAATSAVDQRKKPKQECNECE